MRIKKINQVGDTIIEVLIAIALLSVVLGGAYAISNKSFTDIRQAQEHTEALKYAESQAEGLKQLADGNGSDSAGISIFTTGILPFCLVAGSGLTINTASAGACMPPGAGGSYNISISRIPVTSSSFSFKIAVNWNGIHGGTDNVTLIYRVDK